MGKPIMDMLSSILPSSCIMKNEYLCDHTSLRVGGPVDYLISIVNEEQVSAILSAAKEIGTKTMVLGSGSNILALDGGFRGVALHIGKRMSSIKSAGIAITAQAGASLTALSQYAAARSLTGLEFASGIPGTVGGGVYMNAGAYCGDISQVLSRATVVTKDGIRTLDNKELCFSYRESAVKKNRWVVLSAEFILQAGNVHEIKEKMITLNSLRREKQPLHLPSAGSFFKRPAGYYAGALIEQAGLKGFQVGGARVSDLHAGFLVNTGGALAHDFVELMHQIQDAVLARFGVWLVPEVCIVGQEMS